MKRVALFVAPVALLAFMACNNGRSYNPDTKIESSQNIPASNASQSSPASATNSPTLPPATASAPNASSGKVNPEHGQPGHRCDIAVGAPLPAENLPAAATQPVNPPITTPLTLSPAQGTQQPITNTVPVTAPAPAPAPSKPATGKGLNPAHGQPGHRCDIAVGAPLDSKPAATTTPATTTTTPATQPGTVTSVPKPTPVSTQKVAPGMNPAHGQPGHRCDIAVGEPLNKPAAPATTQQVSPLQPMPVTPLIPPAKADTSKN